jgi:hypothetical protein
MARDKGPSSWVPGQTPQQPLPASGIPPLFDPNMVEQISERERSPTVRESIKKTLAQLDNDASQSSTSEMQETPPPMGAETVFTVRNAIRVGLFWASEYALLSLIEEAPRAVKWATLIGPLAALAVMQWEQKLRSWHRDLVGILLTLLTVGYLAVAAIFGIILAPPEHSPAVDTPQQQNKTTTTLSPASNPATDVIGGPYYPDDVRDMLADLRKLDDILSKQVPTVLQLIRDFFGNWETRYSDETFLSALTSYQSQVEAIRKNIDDIMQNNRFAKELSPSIDQYESVWANLNKL